MDLKEFLWKHNTGQRIQEKHIEKTHTKTTGKNIKKTTN